MDRSFQLIRTNPRLTTNIKFVVDSKYNIYFESFNSSKELSNEKYKHYLLNREAVLEDEIPRFYSNLPKNIAFSPKNEFDADVMYNEYIQQFDNTYFSGANEIEDQWYSEEFEYFAPLYIKKNELPKKFIILRVDEPAIYQKVGEDYIIGELNRHNFREEIIDKWKCISLFDLTDNTTVGKFLDRNITNNNRFPDFSFFFDIKKYNYSKWGGLDYNTGVYKTTEMFLDDKLYFANPHFNLEEFITKGFEENSLIYPYILNMKFLFDDNPGTPNEMREWSMNRYFGFYIDDLELIKIITSYDLVELKDNIIIKNNVFLDSSSGYTNPYVLNYTDDNWIQVDNSYYLVKSQPNGSFKIISDKNLTGYDVSTFNKNVSNIQNTGNRNYITNISDIDNYIRPDGEEDDMFADIYLIDIDGLYHILKKDDEGRYYIHSDYAIRSNKQILQYWKGGIDSKYNKVRDVYNQDGSPLTYNIYRVRLLDIKDFDFDRINTHYADFDYEKSEYYETQEEKLHAIEYRDNSIPLRWKTHSKGEDGQYKVVNVSSEYTATDETFEIRSNSISPMFEKNQSICKWSYDGSISHSDYPYKLNNCTRCGGVNNRTTNVEYKIANYKEKTLDYFYRIGELYGKDVVDIVTGFTSNWAYDTGGDWYRTGGTWIWDGMNNNIAVFNFGGSANYIEYIYDIIPNELYYIELSANAIDTGSTYEMGIDSDSFANATTNQFGSIFITFTGRALSNKLRLFITDADVEVYSIKVTKVIDKYYLNQSTNIQTRLHEKFDSLNDGRFNLEYYVNSEFDYFDFFFKNNMYYNRFGKIYEKPYLKYSIFNGGDNDLPSATLFKGIEYKLYNVEDFVLEPIQGSDEKIRTIITQGGINFNGYKFSVILSENYNLYKLDKNGNSYSNPESLGSRNTSILGSNLLLKTSSDGTHIFLNKKFKNVLIIINRNIPINYEWNSLNNIDVFGENYGLYHGKTLDGQDILPVSGHTNIRRYNPNDLTAFYYIQALNNLNNKKNEDDNYVCYYLIDEDGRFARTEMIRFNDQEDGFISIPNWENRYPLFYLETDTPDNIDIKKNSYKVIPLKGPETNIYDKYLVYSDRKPLSQSYIDQPLARRLEKIEEDETKNEVVHGEKVFNTIKINRFVGYYEPIFKNLSIFKPSYYWKEGDVIKSIVGNYIFNDELDQFGITEEIMYSKVNEFNNFLKLRNSDTERSYFPMVDEIGLSQTSRFIFLSSWDKNFYIKTLNEQTFLQDFVSVPVQVLEVPASAQITGSTVIGGLSISFTNGIQIYGHNKNNTQLQHRVAIRNTSEDSKSIGFRVYYKSNFITTPILYTGVTPVLSPQQVGQVDFSINRPSEIKTGLPAGSYQRYTTWEVHYECYDILKPNVTLDSKTFTNFQVWNDLVSFTLSNTTYELGLGGNHITGNPYNFSYTLTETNNRLTSLNYYTYTKIARFNEPSNFWTGGSLLNQTMIGNNAVPSFNITLNRAQLNWPFSTSGTTNVRFEANHDYVIEGVTKQVSGFTQDSGYKIIGEASLPSLNWANNNISITGVRGNCIGDEYTGDRFTIGSVFGQEIRIVNNGGTFTGNVTITATLYEDNIPMNVTRTISSGSITLISGATYNFSSLTLGPLFDSSSIGIITYNTSFYSARITSLQVSPPFKQSNGMNGYRDPFYICGNQCLDENTLITMSNGSKKPLKHLYVGETVLSYKINGHIPGTFNWVGNISDGEFDVSKVVRKSTSTVKGYYVINDNLKATGTHPIISRDNTGLWKWLSVKDVKVGYKLFKEDGTIVNVNTIRYVDAFMNIVRLDVENTDTFFAGDVLHHNLEKTKI